MSDVISLEAEQKDSQQSFSNDKEFDDHYEVTFDGTDDREDARNLSKLHKWVIVGLIGTGSCAVTCLSSVWSLASDNIEKHFHISHVVSVLGITLYICALGTGGIFLSPISEYYGRKPTYSIGLLFTAIFNLLPGFCDNIGGVLFGRVASGFFASSFMSVASGAFPDMFKKEELVFPVLVYTLSPFIGPGLGALLSGFINIQEKNFRWTFHFITIWLLVDLILVTLFVPETYQPVLLQQKAARLKKETGNTKYHSPLDKEKQTLLEAVVLSSKRPFLLLFKDKMTIVLCFYTGFTLSIVYLFFVSFPYTFETVYHFKIQQVGLSFLALIIGLAIGAILSPILVSKRMKYLAAKNNGIYLPEYRFFSIKIGVFIVPIGLFILAWTSYSNVHWMCPIIGSGIFAVGTMFVFNGIFSYTVDAYRLYAASAMATNSFVRSYMAGVFPLFGVQMYKAMGIQWATTFLALFSCLLIPVAFWFAKNGPLLRKQSPYAWS